MLVSLIALAAPVLSVDNIADGTELRYPLVLFRGAASGESVRIDGTTFPVVDGRYVGFADLKSGRNEVTLTAGGAVKKIRLTFRPPTSKYRVVPIWLTSKDGDGTYYTTSPQRPQRTNEKIDVALKLIQCFTAEAMNDMGYGRKTFAMDFDEKGRTKIQQVRLDKTTAELHAMKDTDTWGYIYGVLDKKFSSETQKWVGLLSATRYDPTTKRALSHFALGGGALACFGTGNMDFWPSTLAEVPKVFADATLVDPNQRFEDSGLRYSVWANASTALGAILHEMGHAFGLPHTVDRYSIMSRGFDHFNRRFSLVEPPYQYHPEAKKYPANQMAYWDHLFATRLNWSRWFQPDRSDYAPGGNPKVRIENDAVVFEAERGIRVIGAESDSRPAVWQPFHQSDPPKRATWSLGWLRERMGQGQTYRITVIDNDGNQTTIEDKS